MSARPIVALDPGPSHTAWVIYRPDTSTVDAFAKEPNAHVLDRLAGFGDDHRLAVEMIASYGRPVGIEVFETCVWIGRYLQAWGRPARRIYRLDVKRHITNGGNANDAVIRQALIDRFGPGKEAAIGRKAAPGPLYGISGDVWAALAVAITAAETSAVEVAA